MFVIEMLTNLLNFYRYYVLLNNLLKVYLQFVLSVKNNNHTKIIIYKKPNLPLYVIKLPIQHQSLVWGLYFRMVPCKALPSCPPAAYSMSPSAVRPWPRRGLNIGLTIVHSFVLGLNISTLLKLHGIVAKYQKCLNSYNNLLSQQTDRERENTFYF